MQRRTIELTEALNTLKQNFDALGNKVNDLYNEKCQLEQFVSRFKNTSRNYLKIRGIAEQIVNTLLSVTSAIIAVVRALRENPDRYAMSILVIPVVIDFTL